MVCAVSPSLQWSSREGEETGGKGYTATPLSYEATPKQDAAPINVSERKPDSESRDEECVGVCDTFRG